MKAQDDNGSIGHPRSGTPVGDFINPVPSGTPISSPENTPVNSHASTPINILSDIPMDTSADTPLMDTSTDVPLMDTSTDAPLMDTTDDIPINTPVKIIDDSSSGKEVIACNVDVKNSELTTSFVAKTKENLQQKISEHEARFAYGMFAGKAVLAPTLNYVNDQISGNNKGKTAISYLQDSLSKLPALLIKTGLLYTISKTILYKADPTVKAMVSRIASDVIYNGAIALFTKQMDPLYKMVSFDYHVKELSLWFVPGAISKVFSMTSATNDYLPNIDELYQKYPEAVGALLGASSEIADLAKTCYDKVHDMIA